MGMHSFIIGTAVFVLSATAFAAPPDPSSFNGTATSGSEIAYTWNSGGGSTAGFYLNVRTNNYPRSYCRNGTQIDVGNVTSYNLTGLQPNTTYYVRLCAYDSGGSKSKGKRTADTTLNQQDPAPSIASITPSNGSDQGGTMVVITGSDFNSPTVSLGGSNCAVSSASASSISCTTSAHSAGAVNVVVTNGDSQSDTLSNGYTYDASPPPPAPSITSIAPANGAAAGGTAVVISGSDFSGPSVSIGGANCAVTASSASSINCTTGAHSAGAVDVVVTNSDGQSDTLSNGYTYDAPPPAFLEMSQVDDLSADGGDQDWAESVVAQADGKIVVAGRARNAGNVNLDYSVVRYNADGSLDSSFGNGGQVLFGFGGSHDVAYGVKLDSQNRIVVVGYTRDTPSSDYDWGIARLNPNGTFDTSFDGDGKKLIDFRGENDQAYELAIDSQDRIIVAGKSRVAGFDFDFAVVRLNTDGSVDWQTETDFTSGSQDVPWGVKIQSDGKIVLAGRTQPVGGNKESCLARYNDDGSLDTTFGNGGKVVTSIGATIDDNYFGLALDGDKIVGIGKQITGPDMDLFLTRYNSDGSLDTSFGTNGVALYFLSTFDDKAFKAVVDGQGRYLVAASIADSNDDFDFAVMRFNHDGSLDTSFGPSAQGYERYDLGTTRDQALSIDWDANGKLVLTGRAENDTAVMRVNPDGQ